MSEKTWADFDIKLYWGILQRRKHTALAVALAVISLFAWGSMFWPKTYMASSTVFIEKSSLIDPLIKGVGVSGSMEDRLKTLKNSITSRSIIARVIRRLDMDSKMKNPEQLEGLIEGIRRNLKITVKGSVGERETDLFTISYTGSNPRAVRDVVNTLVSEYIEENVRFRRTDAFGAFEFIKGQLAEYKTKLEESDRTIREFREKNPGMIPQSENTLLGRVESFQTSRIETDIRLKELQRRRVSLNKQLSGEKELTVAFVTRDGSPQARLNYLNSQLILLMSKYTDKHPEIIKIKVEIEELKRQVTQAKDVPRESSSSETAAMNPVYQQLKEELARTEAEIESLRARSSELLRQRREAQNILGRMPKEQEEWAKLQRDRNVYQKIYDDLSQKLENARVSKDLELTDKAATFRIIDPALLPLSPVRPDRVLMILLGFGVGIAAGIGTAFAVEYSDQSYKDEESVEKDLKLPVLASIPKIFTEEDRLAERVRDKKVFTFAGGYLLVIVLLLAGELFYRSTGIKILYF